MPRFAAVLPEGRLLLKNLETGETLTIRAEDGPVSIGTLTWTWGEESSPAGAPEGKRSETVVEDAGPRPMKPEEYDALEWNPNDPALLTAEAEMRAILASAQEMRGRDVMPAAKRVLSAPLSALTEKDFEETYMALGKQSDDQVSKAETIARVIDELGLSASDAVMVGDRHHDVDAAAACGVPCVGVTYGGTAAPGELEEAGACSVASSVDELRRVLLG